MQARKRAHTYACMQASTDTQTTHTHLPSLTDGVSGCGLRNSSCEGEAAGETEESRLEKYVLWCQSK